MESLVLAPGEFNPEIVLDHSEKKFHIKGNSRPEDVRGVYLPVVEWIHNYRIFISKDNTPFYTEEQPLIFEFEFVYFNSSTAKFLFDIVNALKQIKENGIPVVIAWLYEEEDTDMLEAGEDLAYLAELDFAYIPK